MTTNDAIPSFFFALAMVSSGSIAMAESSATKPAPRAAPSPKPAPVPKAASWVDPFEELSTPIKPGAGPALPAPPKPGAMPAAPPAQNLPSKELEAFMKGLEGRWKCDTKFAAGSVGPGSQPLNAKTEVTIKKQFGGYSWHGEFKLAKTTTTSATSGVFHIGYAAGTKQATFLSYDSVGSAMMGVGKLASDSVTFAEEGFLKGVEVKVRETLATRGPRKIYHKVEIEQGKGYQPMAEDTCVK
jgi:hypothetical protein